MGGSSKRAPDPPDPMDTAAAQTGLNVGTGIANQLLAAVALAVATTIVINLGRARYAWVTAVPLAFVSVTTLSAGVLSVRDNFWPMAIGPDASKHFQGYLDTALTVVMMVCVVVILANALWRCTQVLRGRLAIMGEPAPSEQ